MSVQSMDEQILKNIRRSNIGRSQALKNLPRQIKFRKSKVISQNL